MCLYALLLQASEGGGISVVRPTESMIDDLLDSLLYLHYVLCTNSASNAYTLYTAYEYSKMCSMWALNGSSLSTKNLPL